MWGKELGTISLADNQLTVDPHVFFADLFSSRETIVQVVGRDFHGSGAGPQKGRQLKEGIFWQ